MDLNIFTDEQRTLLVSLPFKAGICISHADDIEGEDDDVQERKALEICLREIVKSYEGEAFVSGIVEETLRRRDEWAAWSEKSWSTPEEARKVAAFLHGTVPKKLFFSYGKMITEIASAVARAFGEYGSFDDNDAREGFFAKIIGGFRIMSGDDPGHPMNVSASEDEMIAALATAFRVSV
jgi:hypothetical protein